MGFLQIVLFLWLSGLVAFFVSLPIFSFFELEDSYRFALLDCLILFLSFRLLFWSFLSNTGVLLIVSVALGVVFAGISHVTYHPSSPEVASQKAVTNRYFGWILTAILVIAVFVRMYEIGPASFLTDEYLHFNTAVGYLEVGEFRFWNFLSLRAGKDYPRAWSFTWLVAQSLRWFGVSVFSARLVSFFWGVLLFLPFYRVCKDLNLGSTQFLIAFLLLAITPYAVTSSRWIRHYSMYTFFYLSLLTTVNKLDGTIGTTSYKWLIPVSLFGVICLHLHFLPTLLLLGVLMVYEVFRLALSELEAGNFSPEKRIPLIALFLTAGIIGTLLLSGKGWAELGQISFKNLFYGFFFTHELFGFALGGSVFGFVLWQSMKRDTVSRFYALMVVLPLPAYLILDRSIPQIRYVGHFFPLFIALTSREILNLIPEGTKLTFGRRSLLSLIISLVVVGVPAYQFSQNLPFIWQGHSGFVSFPQDKSPPYRASVKWLRSKVFPRDEIALVNFPEYAAATIAHPRDNVHWQGYSGRRLRKGKLVQLSKKTGRLWVLFSSEMGTGRKIEPWLNRHLKSVSLPRPLEGRGISVYRTESSKR